MRRRGLVANLYRTARLANDISVIASGNPHRVARRVKNKIIGRLRAEFSRRRVADSDLCCSGAPGGV